MHLKFMELARTHWKAFEMDSKSIENYQTFQEPLEIIRAHLNFRRTTRFHYSSHEEHSDMN